MFANEYNTMYIKPHKSQLIKNHEEDGLPTILEQSCAEPIGNGEDKFLEGYKTKPAETVRNSDVHGLHSMTALKLQYKHRRMQSKNALFNKYKSLSLMNGDDMTSQILHQSGQIYNEALKNSKLKQDFDDISSIYDAAKVTNDDLGKTMRRIKNRDELLSNFDEDINYINNELDHFNKIEEQDQEHDVSQYMPTHENKEEDDKEDKIIERYYSATQKTREANGTKPFESQNSAKNKKEPEQSLDEQLRDESADHQIDLNKANSDIHLSRGESEDDDDSQDSKKIQRNLEEYDLKNYIAEDYSKIKQLIDDQKLIRDGI